MTESPFYLSQRIVMIRLASASDATQIQAIYAPIVRDTVISFELEVPDVDTIVARIRATRDAGFPWLVAERDDRIVGYAYASRHRERAAYDWSTDVSVYVHEDARGRGIGRALYTSLFAVLALQGYHNAYAGATLPNPASVALHEAVGFREIGVYRNVGYKAGAWHDVIWWGRTLTPHTTKPRPLLHIDQAAQHEAWQQAIAAGMELLPPEQ